MQEKTGPEARKKVHELIKDARTAMLATRREDGYFHARPMATSEAEFDGTLWFLTDRRTHKVEQLQADPEVLVTYSDIGGSNYVSVAGEGEIVTERDTIRQIWSEPARAWFPDGVNDPNLVAMKVEVASAEYWDAPSGLLVMAYGYAKAVLTGKRTSNTPGVDHGVARY